MRRHYVFHAAHWISLLAPTASAQVPSRTEEAKLAASDGAAGDELGSRVSMDGGVIAASALPDGLLP